MTEHYDPTGPLPELPSDVESFAAGMWAAATLLQAAADRGWSREQLRMQLALVLVGLAGVATDEQLHGELQQALDASRAHRARKQ